MKECWYALTLAILAPRPLYPEEAFEGLAEGKLRTRSLDIVVPDMLSLRGLGDSWDMVAELFGYSNEDARTLACRWKRRQRLKAVKA